MTRNITNLPIKKFIYLAVTASITASITASCSTITVNQRTPSHNIQQQRGNIVTKNVLSNRTSATLLHSGQNNSACLANFDTCINGLNNILTDSKRKQNLALFAELHFAKAKSIADLDSCQNHISRPPIDPYYANATVPKEKTEQYIQSIIECKYNYLNELLNAIRYSYAYLFYEQLQTPNNNADQIQPSHLFTDLDIQTQDVYNVASDALIKELYSNRTRIHKATEITNFIGAEILAENENFNPTTDPKNKSANFGEQIKLLSYTINTPKSLTINSHFEPFPKINVTHNSENEVNITTRNNIASSHSNLTPSDVKTISDNTNTTDANRINIHNSSADYLESDNTDSQAEYLNQLKPAKTDLKINHHIPNPNNPTDHPIINANTLNRDKSNNEDIPQSSSHQYDLAYAGTYEQKNQNEGSLDTKHDEHIDVSAGNQLSTINFDTSSIVDSSIVSSSTMDYAEDFADFVTTNQDTQTTNNTVRNAKNIPIDINIFFPNEPEYLKHAPKYNQNADKLYASHDLDFSGLNIINLREGVGINYVTLLDDSLNASISSLLKTKGQELNTKEPASRIRMMGNLVLTGVITPKGNDLDSVLNSHSFDINMYNPHRTEVINVLGKPYYLAANFSASYGMWLAKNKLDNVSYFSLLAKQQALILPQLYMLEPYDPDKRVIIMLHGLASSPATWVSVTNDILNDPQLRNSYQVWQIFYPTNIPMLENRYQIQKLIETAYKTNDPTGTQQASKHSVLVGHSMGAVIGRMLLSNDNLEENLDKLKDNKTSLNLSRLISSEIDQQNIRNRLYLAKLESVDEAVFISAPFKGTDFADRWFTQILRRIIGLPLGFVQTIKGNLTNIATEGELTANPLGALYLQNGASQLSDKSAFMKLTADLKIADGITYHSIIANNDSDILHGLHELNINKTPQTQLSHSNTISINYNHLTNDKLLEDLNNNLSDGIVPYQSSHLEGATSETIISGGHSIQATPEAVITLRKILHEHLKKYPIKE